MKTFVVLSDTHGNVAAVEKLAPIMAEADYVIFLGDGLKDLSRFALGNREKFRLAEGNCDFFSTGEKEGFMEVEGVKLMFCHGHRYSVKRGLEELLTRAKQENCTLALYGHTHEARIDRVDGVTLINPGSMTRFTTKPSYCYLVIHQGKITAQIVEIF